MTALFCIGTEHLNDLAHQYAGPWKLGLYYLPTRKLFRARSSLLGSLLTEQILPDDGTRKNYSEPVLEQSLRSKTISF